MSSACFVFRKPLPALDIQATATLLDQRLMKLRTQILQQISKAAEKTKSNNPLKKLIAKAEDWLYKISLVSLEVHQRPEVWWS